MVVVVIAIETVIVAAVVVAIVVVVAVVVVELDLLLGVRRSVLLAHGVVFADQSQSS